MKAAGINVNEKIQEIKIAEMMEIAIEENNSPVSPFVKNTGMNTIIVVMQEPVFDGHISYTEFATACFLSVVKSE